MENKSFSSLTIRPISEVVDEAKVYIDKRRTGLEKSLKVSSNKVNNTFMGGLDWNRIITIAGLPGSGKSTLLRQ